MKGGNKWFVVILTSDASSNSFFLSLTFGIISRANATQGAAGAGQRKCSSRLSRLPQPRPMGLPCRDTHDISHELRAPFFFLSKSIFFCFIMYFQEELKRRRSTCLCDSCCIDCVLCSTVRHFTCMRTRPLVPFSRPPMRRSGEQCARPYGTTLGHPSRLTMTMTRHRIKP